MITRKLIKIVEIFMKWWHWMGRPETWAVKNFFSVNGDCGRLCKALPVTTIFSVWSRYQGSHFINFGAISNFPPKSQWSFASALTLTSNENKFHLHFGTRLENNALKGSHCVRVCCNIENARRWKLQSKHWKVFKISHSIKESQKTTRRLQ